MESITSKSVESKELKKIQEFYERKNAMKIALKTKESRNEEGMECSHSTESLLKSAKLILEFLKTGK